MGSNITKVSLGVLQFPSAARPEAIDSAKRSEALRCAIDRGAGFLNLGLPYLFSDPEKACAWVREALSGGYAEKVSLALNIPAAYIEKAEDLDRYLGDQLGWYGLEKIDACIIHGIYRGNWAKLKKLGLAAWMDAQLESGKVGSFGYSFHDEPHYITVIDEYYPKWEFIQIDYSFMDERHHPGSGGLAVAKRDGLTTIASQCMSGGCLVKNIPEDVAAVWAEYGERTPAEWCIRWSYNNPAVDSVLFEFESVEEVKFCLDIAEDAVPEGMSISELGYVRRASAAYTARREFACTTCRCCMPCNLGADAVRVAELYNDYLMYGDEAIPVLRYKLEGHSARPCISCGRCVKLCPRKNDLPGVFAKMEALASGKQA